MRALQDVEANTEGTPVLTGTEGADPVTGAPIPVGPILSRRFATVAWDYTEPKPGGALRGFEVVLYLGDDPDNTATYVLPPQICKPQDRSLQVLLELRSQQTISASVRALYPDGYASAWVKAPAGAVFVPSVQAYGSSGSIKFPDGTLMQWIRSEPYTAEGQYPVTWPVTFPNKIYSVQLTEENPSATKYDDALFQLVSMDEHGCVIYKQIVSGSPAQGSRCNILAFGF